MNRLSPTQEELARPSIAGISGISSSSSNTVVVSFPSKVYTMLEDAETRGFEDIVAWQQGGKSFKIYQPEVFASSTMQVYFSQSKFKSFQRQLNIYGWKKIQFGPHKGGYIHRMFVRGKPELFKGIVRRDPRKDNNHGARGLSPKRGSSNGGNHNNNSRNTANGNNHGARISASTSRMMRPPLPPPPVPLPPPFAPIMMPAVDVALRRLEAHHARAPSVDLEMLIMEAKMHQNNTALLAEEGELHAPTPPPSRHHHQQRHHHHAREPSIDVEMFLLEAAKMTTTTTTMSTRPSSSLSSSSAANNQPRRRPQPQHARDPSLDLHASEIETFYEFFYPQDPIEKSLINSAVFNNNNNNIMLNNTNNDYDNDTLDSVSSGAQEGEEEEQLFSTMLSLCDDDLNGFVTMLSNDHDAAGTSSHEEYPDEGEEYGEHYQPEEEPSSLSLSSFPSPAAVLVGANKKRQASAPAPAPAPPLGRAATTDDADHADDEDLECSDLGFPSKLHLMLENAERDNYVHIVSWVKDGTAFKVHNHKEFVHRVMPVYFDQSMYESFRRQLNLYHFSRCSRGQDRGVISHPLLRAGARHLCSGIKRGKVVVVNDAPGSLLPPSAMVLSEGESVRRMSL